MLNTLIDKLDSPDIPDLNKIDQLFEEFYFDFNLPSSKFVAFLLNQTGKKLRPLLLLLSAKIAGGVNDFSYKSATIFEALHTASLIHDDIIDFAEMRRGENSMNQQFGNKLAVLAGDFILSRSLYILSREKNSEIITLFAKASEDLCLGEILEQKSKHEGNVSETQYFEIIRLKTASLFSGCCEAGVMTSDGSKVLRQKMKTFGEHFGIAFQLKDDLLDFLGNANEIGKEVGMDNAGNLVTFPLLSVLQDLPDKIKHQWQTYTFSEIKKMISDYGGFFRTEKEISKYSQLSYDILNQLESSKEVELLREIVKLNIERKS